MHTGNARGAFQHIASKIKTGGSFVVNVYARLNVIWELNDWLIRLFTTNLSIDQGLKLSLILAKLGAILDRNKYIYALANLLFRIQPTVHHMYDWYLAPTASHHTVSEVAKWFKLGNFEIKDDVDSLLEKESKLFFKPWAINMRGVKN